jgi:hypothetical protein
MARWVVSENNARVLVHIKRDAEQAFREARAISRAADDRPMTDPAKRCSSMTCGQLRRNPVALAD